MRPAKSPAWPGGLLDGSLAAGPDPSYPRASKRRSAGQASIRVELPEVPARRGRCSAILAFAHTWAPRIWRKIVSFETHAMRK